MDKDIVIRTFLEDYKKEDPYKKNCPVCKGKMRWSDDFMRGTRWYCSNCTETTYINKIEILQMINEELNKEIVKWKEKAEKFYYKITGGILKK